MVTQPAISKNRFCMSEVLLKRVKKKSFLHRIVIGNENWIHYDAPNSKKSYVKPDQTTRSPASPNIHDAKLCSLFGVIRWAYYIKSF